MVARFFCRKVNSLLVLISIFTTALESRAVTILSGPTFTKATNAPLAGLLELTTDRLSRVGVSVDDGTNQWVRNFHDYSTNHSIPLLGFRPGKTNVITVTVYDQYRQATNAAPLTFVTGPLPSDFPPCILVTNQPDKMDRGYILLRNVNRNTARAYLTVVNKYAEVIWYSTVATTSDVRQLGNGDLFIPLTTSFVEVDMLGRTVQTWNVPSGLNINLHDGVPTPHGTILYLNDASEVVSNFPTSATDPNAPLQTTNVLYNRVVEISATNSSLLNLWSPINVLDPRRLTYLTFQVHTPQGWDIEHANAVIEDPSDDTLIVSMREQNAVIKLARSTGQVWILGPPENWGPAFQNYLLTPVGTPFEWQYGQHAPVITRRGSLLLFDDGNFRASPYAPPVADANNYSRAVEYAIDEDTMTVRQVWEYGQNASERLYIGQVGNADELPTLDHVLVNFGYVSYDNGLSPSPTAPGASMIRIQEVTRDDNPQVVFDMAVFNYTNTSPSYLGCGPTAPTKSRTYTLTRRNPWAT